MKVKEARKEVQNLNRKVRRLIREVMGETDKNIMIEKYREIRSICDRISELREFIRTHP